MEPRSLPYAKQHIDETDIEAVTRALKSPWITRGPSVAAFEEAVAAYCGSSYGVAFSSGSTALMAVALALEVTPFDRILTTVNTFVSTLGSFTLFGAHPVLVDIDPATGNVDLTSLLAHRSKIQSKGRDIFIPVHFAGIPFPTDQLLSQLNHPQSILIEDGAQALGSSYSNGLKVGSSAHSDMTILSFHPAKIVTTGEGGMVLTRDKYWSDKLKLIRNNGIVLKDSYPGNYEVERLSSNFHMNEMEAALGLAQMKKLDRAIEKRKTLVNRYEEELKKIPYISLMEGTEGTAWHLMVVQIDFNQFKIQKKELIEELKKRGIGTQVHYPPLYSHPPFQKDNPSSSFPKMEKYFREAVTLPLFTEMEEEDVVYVSQSLKEILELKG